ncbi:MAG: response regulator transcription factor [Pseudomonadota bacterium]|nr:MAG: DNA-binding response regulator [Pseudomonadota bacterium]
MRVLLAEDDTRLAERIATALTASGFAVDVAGNGVDALHLGNVEPYDAVVLDLGLPQVDGLTVLERWRDTGIKTPVLVLTARGRWHEKLAGFNAGADDYLTKPFEMDEVVVRLKALIRRSAGHATAQLRCGELELDVNAARFSYAGEPVSLTAQEYRILAFLMHHQRRLVSRTELIEHVYDRDFDRDSNVIDVLIGRIRKKLPGALLRTVRGQGFILEPPADEA